VAQKFFNAIGDRISRWWLGEFRPYKNDPDSAVVLIGGRYHRHWTADVAHAIVDFYLRHWQFVWTTALAIVGLVIAALAIK
jgi:hypothetical protein